MNSTIHFLIYETKAIIFSNHLSIHIKMSLPSANNLTSTRKLKKFGDASYGVLLHKPCVIMIQ